MKYLILAFSVLFASERCTASHTARLADVEVQFGPFLYYDDDDDDFLYDDNFYNQTGVNIWIGPGLYYGVWFDNEYQYRYWARRNYYYRHGWNRYYRGYPGRYRDRGYEHRDHHGRGERGGGGGKGNQGGGQNRTRRRN